MPGDAANSHASQNGNAGSDELTGKFLPGLQTQQVVQQSREENDRGGREKVSNNAEVAVDHRAELKGRKKYGERSQIGDEYRDAADTGDGSRVELADIVRFVYQAPADREVPDLRRQDKRY